MIEKYDVDDIKVRSKYIDLRLRSESITTTRLFSENLNLPFVTFIIKNDEIIFSPPTKIKLINNIVHFDSPDLSGSISLQVDSLLLQAQAYGSRVGVMWPNSKSECYFANEMLPIDKKFTTTGQFNQSSDDPTFLDINIPAVHMVSDQCLMVHSQLQDPIKFCFFYHNFMPYWNAISKDVLQLVFRPCSSIRSGLSMYYGKHGRPQQPVVTEQTSLEQMKKCLYTNTPIVSISTPKTIMEKPKQIQQQLDEHGIENCFIGSLAMHIHGFSMGIKDFDVVVESISDVKKHFETIQVSDSQKWSNCGARLTLESTHVDFVELPRFDWNQVEEINGFKVLSISGLLSMKLAGEYERMQMEPNYDNFKLKNNANIDLLLQKSPFVYPFFEEFLKIHSIENYLKLQNLLQGAAWDSVPMRINDPLLANVFSKEDTTLLPVVNNGSEISAKIRIERHISTAQWFPIGQCPTLRCDIDIHSNWSDIIIPKVKTLGLLVCQNA